MKSFADKVRIITEKAKAEEIALKQTLDAERKEQDKKYYEEGVAEAIKYLSHHLSKIEEVAAKGERSYIIFTNASYDVNLFDKGFVEQLKKDMIEEGFDVELKNSSGLSYTSHPRGCDTNWWTLTIKW